MASSPATPAFAAGDGPSTSTPDCWVASRPDGKPGRTAAPEALPWGHRLGGVHAHQSTQASSQAPASCPRRGVQQNSRSAAASGVGRVNAWQRSAGKLAVESANKLEYNADGTVKKKTFDLFQLTDLASGGAMTVLRRKIRPRTASVVELGKKVPLVATGKHVELWQQAIDVAVKAEYRADNEYDSLFPDGEELQQQKAAEAARREDDAERRRQAMAEQVAKHKEFFLREQAKEEESAAQQRREWRERNKPNAHLEANRARVAEEANRARVAEEARRRAEEEDNRQRCNLPLVREAVERFKALLQAKQERDAEAARQRREAERLRRLKEEARREEERRLAMFNGGLRGRNNMITHLSQRRKSTYEDLTKLTIRWQERQRGITALWPSDEASNGEEPHKVLRRYSSALDSSSSDTIAVPPPARQRRSWHSGSYEQPQQSPVVCAPAPLDRRARAAATSKPAE